ncbi:hypothetical protein HN51_040476 [Arachis hypogaea]
MLFAYLSVVKDVGRNDLAALIDSSQEVAKKSLEKVAECVRCLEEDMAKARERVELQEFSLGSCPPSVGIQGMRWSTIGDKAPAARSSPPPSTRWTAIVSFSIHVLHRSRSSLVERSRSVVSSSSAVTSSSAHGHFHHFLFSPSSFVNLSESDQPSFFSIVFALGSSTDQVLWVN